MPEYGVPQSGYNRTDPGKNLRAISPGDNYVLLDGTEADEELASVAIVRGPSNTMSQAYSTFYAQDLDGASVDVQSSNTDEDGDYVTIGTMDASAPYFTDSGSPLFYRVKKDGGTPSVKVQR